MRLPTLRRACCWFLLVAAGAGVFSVSPGCGGEAAPAATAGPNAGARPKASSPERIQFNGTYQAVLHDGRGAEIGLEYLRFSSDGAVRSLTSSAPIDASVGPTAEDKMQLRSGTFTATGNNLTFSTASASRTVEYAGTIRGGELMLKWRSEKEGTTGSALFSFVAMAAGEPPPEQPGAGRRDPSPAAPPAPSPPNETFKPAGASWSCTRARDAQAMSHCERTPKACQNFRKEVLAKLPKEKFSDCAEQAKAACHTMIDKLAQKGIAFCYQRISDCEEAGRQIRVNENPADYEVSDCASW
jgi:hypothetical protein